jgi:hypothetical protein
LKRQKELTPTFAISASTPELFKCSSPKTAKAADSHPLTWRSALTKHDKISLTHTLITHPSIPLRIPHQRTMAAPTAFDDTLDQFLEKPAGQTEADFLLAWEERWNKRIDKDVQVLGEGLGKMVDAFEVRSVSLALMRGVADGR